MLPFLFFLIQVLACCEPFFFFQAEDGIRDRNVTGVQTCALRSTKERTMADRSRFDELKERSDRQWAALLRRSEERRVGKECRSRWSRDHYKQKNVSGRGVEVGRRDDRRDELTGQHGGWW